MPKVVYEVRFQNGRWAVVRNDVVLFDFADRKDAVARADDVAFGNSRLSCEVEIQIFGESGELAQRYSSLDFEI